MIYFCKYPFLFKQFCIFKIKVYHMYSLYPPLFTCHDTMTVFLCHETVYEKYCFPIHNPWKGQP